MSSRHLDKEIRSLLTKLLTGYRTYFDKTGLLNSEGRKLFEGVARLVVREHPERKEIISKARRNPTLENIIKVAVMYVDEGEVYELLRNDYLH